MSLRDNVIALCRAPYAYTMVEGDTRTPAEVRADAILALVQAHMTSDEAVARAVQVMATITRPGDRTPWDAASAAILAALEGDK